MIFLISLILSIKSSNTDINNEEDKVCNIEKRKKLKQNANLPITNKIYQRISCRNQENPENNSSSIKNVKKDELLENKTFCINQENPENNSSSIKNVDESGIFYRIKKKYYELKLKKNYRKYKKLFIKYKTKHKKESNSIKIGFIHKNEIDKVCRDGSINKIKEKIDEINKLANRYELYLLIIN